ncbi:MAG TPA: 4-hydroxybenzoate octaprenyltransferase [Geminicoccaceae bacterium]|nr:4-hydroxybenzoate octaprenyltransferase [Geminicoccaceae bacterium]
MARQAVDTPHVADRQASWLDWLPLGLRPYGVLARWDRPIGSWLLLWPCWWGMALAAPWPDPWRLALFAIGAVAMRGAGCVINDLTDRELDARVERTRNRPLASGRLSVGQALVFLALQLLVGVLVLVQLNAFTIGLALTVMPLVLVYPWMKRITWWPQACLGLTFNWGALVGWSAVTGGLAAPALVLYAAGFFWTLGYDTIYAHQDKLDDALVGIRSSARRLGAATVPWLWAFYGIALALLALAGALRGASPWFYPALVPAALHLAWQIRTLDIDDPVNCLLRFRSNRALGLLVFAAILAGHW